jgi:hypothetical protein
MNNGFRLLAAPLTLCLASLPALWRDEPQGRVVSVSINIAKHGKLTSTRISVGDQVIDESTLPIEIDRTQHIEYRDHFQKVEGPEVQCVEREFLKIRGEYKETNDAAVNGGVIQESETSLLEGVKLAFSWDPKLEAYDVAVKGDDEVGDLSRLRETVKPSFSSEFLNPSNGTKAKGRWKLPTVALRDLVLEPGGDLFAITPATISPGQKFAIRQRKAYLDSIVGDVYATVTQEGKDQDQNHIHVSLSGNISSSLSILFVDDGSARRQSMETAKISGTVLWDKNKDRLESITLDAAKEVHTIDDLVVEGPGGKAAGKLDGVVAATDHWELRFSYELESEAK